MKSGQHKLSDAQVKSIFEDRRSGKLVAAKHGISRSMVYKIWNRECYGSMLGDIKLVILESPYAGAVADNVAYAKRAARDAALKGESVLASHLLFPQFLDDADPDERALGTRLGLAWRRLADYSVFYIDRGWSRGMVMALSSSLAEGKPFKIRALDGALILPDGCSETTLALLRSSIDSTGSL